MNSLRKHRPFILGAIVAVALIGAAWGPVFGWHRPYVNWAPWDLAQYLADNGRDPRECLDLIFIEIMSPSQAEQQALCVFEYAKITKDPSACELLMPSSYGWSCLGVAQATRDECSIDYAKEVSWVIEGTENDWKTASFNTCINTRTSDDQQNSCCYILQLTSDPNINDCSQFAEHKNYLDLCNSQLALKTKNPSLCGDITDSNKKAICEVQARSPTR